MSMRLPFLAAIGSLSPCRNGLSLCCRHTTEIIILIFFLFLLFLLLFFKIIIIIFIITVFIIIFIIIIFIFFLFFYLFIFILIVKFQPLPSSSSGYLNLGHDLADGRVDHGSSSVAASLAVRVLGRRDGAVEHVLRVAHAILSRLVLAAERGRVLELLQTPVFGCQTQNVTFGEGLFTPK